MTRAQKEAEARRLREEGLSYRQIAKRLGYQTSDGSSITWALLHPEAHREKTRLTNAKRAAAKREWERDPRNRVPCLVCGGPTGHTPGQKESEKCRACFFKSERERVDANGHEIERLWAEGRTLAEIAVRFGWTVNHLGVEMTRLRARGFGLPYRRQPSNPKHPELKAAA